MYTSIFKDRLVYIVVIRCAHTIYANVHPNPIINCMRILHIILVKRLKLENMRFMSLVSCAPHCLRTRPMVISCGLILPNDALESL